jgi:chromosome partitioning protein
MPVVVIANPKGGVGKSTLSTQVAGYFASKGHATMLGDTKRALLRFKLQVQQHEAI